MDERAELIAWANEWASDLARGPLGFGFPSDSTGVFPRDLQNFRRIAALLSEQAEAVAAEREQCAKAVLAAAGDPIVAARYAAAIRAKND
jgi:hypothetical protein